MMMGREKAAAAMAVTDAPRAPDGRLLIGVRGLLEWAFSVEHARLEFRADAPSGFGVRSTTSSICEMVELGGMRIDVSPGRSYPHDDADLIASVVVTELDRDGAMQVANHARTCTVPAWDLPPTQCLPVAWRRVPGREPLAQTESPPRKSFRRGGRLVQYTPVVCPVRYAPTAEQIGAARRAYLAWVLNLLHLRGALQRHDFKRFVMTDVLPSRRPWKNTC